MKSQRTCGGFTLLEVLVVLGIGALLLGVIMFSVQAGKEKAYDAQRASDLGQLQVALRIYRDVNGSHPTGTLQETELNTILTPYLTGAVRDPKSGTSGYGYVYVEDFPNCGGPILYAESTDRGTLANWIEVCPDAGEPGTDTYVIKL